MHPKNFPQSNAKLDTPVGISPDMVPPICAHICEVNGMVAMTTCWKLSPEDLAELQRTGEIWLWVLGNRHPPVTLSTKNPFSAVNEVHGC